MTTAAASQSSFAIDGMFCGGCAATVERALMRVPGVAAASVSFVSDAALVRHDESVSRERLAAVITQLGYGARTLDEDGAAANEGAREKFLLWHRLRLIIAIFFGMWTMLASLVIYLGQLPDQQTTWFVALASGVFAMPVLAFSGSAFYRLGWRSLRAGAPGMEALISIAVITAAVVSTINLIRGNTFVYFDAAVMLITFQLIARLTDFSVRRSAGDAVRRLLQLAPEQARRVCAEDTEMVHPRALASGDIIETRPGERISADGIVASGRSRLDSSVLSGESMPRTLAAGDEVSAGELVLDGVLRIEVTAPGGKRRIDALATEVRRLLVGKGTLARIADQVARWLLPTIVVAAVLALLLALYTGAGWQDGLARALAVIIVTCPCALSLAVPLTLTAAASAGARNGIILRDPGVLENASRINTIVFDKTGTLTAGRPEVVAVHCAPGVARAAVLQAAASAEAGSLHPLARAICRAAQRDAGQPPADVREIAGCGVEASAADGRLLRIGSAAWFRDCGLQPLRIRKQPATSRVEVAHGAQVLGTIELADPLRDEAQPIIERLQQRGYRVVLASGDGDDAVQAVAARLGIEGHARLLPQDKLDLLAQWRAQGLRVAFIGDGINDGPALAAADLGIAVGDANDLARSAAAVGLLEKGMAPVETALYLAVRAGRILRQNLVWAVAYNGLILPAAVLGFVNPVFAALAMTASSISVSLNAMRAGWTRSGKGKPSHRPAGGSRQAPQFG